MAVSTTGTIATYTGDGSSVNFNFPYYFKDPSHLIVRVAGVIQTYNSAYTVTTTQDAHSGLYSSGTIVFVTAPAVAAAISIQRQTPLVQTTVYNPDDSFPYNSHEAALDYLTLIDQEQSATSTNNAILYPSSETIAAGSNVLPVAASRAGKYIFFNATGTLQVGAITLGTWRGNYAASIAYAINDFFKDNSTGNVYVSLKAYTSVSIAADLAALNIALLMQAPTNTLTTVADYAADGGAANVYAATISGIASYVAGLRVCLNVAHTNTGNSTLNVNSLGAKNIKLLDGTNPAAGQILAGAVQLFEYDGTNFQLINPVPVVSNAPVNGAQTQGRLTLTSGTPITTSDVTGAGTLYLTAYKGNKFSVYSGGVWSVLTLSSDLALVLSGLTASTMYDIWIYNNSGSLAFDQTAWTNVTTRATALALQDGVLVKNGDSTRKWVGSIYVNASKQCEDSVANRLVFNYYNQTVRSVKVTELTANWTYNTAAWRAARAQASNSVNIVTGLSEEMLEATVLCSYGGNNANEFVAVGVGINSTTVNSAYTGGAISSGQTAMLAEYRGILPIGLNNIAWLEYGSTGNGTFYANNTPCTAGLTGSVRM